MATTTETYNFTKPDASDNVSPAPFNENFDKIEAILKELRVDYVVSQGVQGIWDYRRWASGIAECWVEEYTVPTLNITDESRRQGSYGDYSGRIDSVGDFPFEFEKPPIVIPTLCSRGDASTTNYSFPIWTVPNSGTTTKCPAFQCADPSKGTLKNVKIGIFVKGRCVV